MRARSRWAYGRRMPRRAPIDPQGHYHVGSRGAYGLPLFLNDDQHECFLRMHTRVSRTYGIETLAWALVKNRHHFVVRLTNGGLSEAMRELHGGFSRWVHEQFGLTRQGHLFRHAFFARELKTEGDVLVACSYVDLNLGGDALTGEARGKWCGLRATIGLEHPRPFHRPSGLLELIDRRPAAARAAYEKLVRSGLALREQVPSPNDVVPPRG